MSCFTLFICVTAYYIIYSIESGKRKFDLYDKKKKKKKKKKFFSCIYFSNVIYMLQTETFGVIILACFDIFATNL